MNKVIKLEGEDPPVFINDSIISKSISIEDGKVIDIDTERLKVSIEETFNDLYHYPAAKYSSRGIPLEAITRVLQDSDGKVSIKHQHVLHYHTALNQWLAWRHGAKLYYPYAGSNSKPVSLIGSEPNLSPRVAHWTNEEMDRVEGLDTARDHVLIYQVCAYISLNYMKNIGKTPARWTSEELEHAADTLKSLSGTTGKRRELSFSSTIVVKDSTQGYVHKYIDVKVLADTVNKIINGLYIDPKYDNIEGITADMVKLVLEKRDGIVRVKPMHEEQFLQALDLWLARRHELAKDTKFTPIGSVDKSHMSDQDRVNVNLFIHQVCRYISLNYMKNIGIQPMVYSCDMIVTQSP